MFLLRNVWGVDLASLGGTSMHSPVLSSSVSTCQGTPGLVDSPLVPYSFHTGHMWETLENLLLHATSTGVTSLMVARDGLGWTILHLQAKTTRTAVRYQGDIPSSDYMLMQWSLGSLKTGSINAGSRKPRVC